MAYQPGTQEATVRTTFYADSDFVNFKPLISHDLLGQSPTVMDIPVADVGQQTIHKGLAKAYATSIVHNHYSVALKNQIEPLESKQVVRSTGERTTVEDGDQRELAILRRLGWSVVSFNSSKVEHSSLCTIL